MGVGAQTLESIRESIPAIPVTLSRYELFSELDRLIGLCNSVRSNAAGDMLWAQGLQTTGGKYAPVFLVDCLWPQVTRVLVNIGPGIAAVALRSFRKIDCWGSKAEFKIRKSIIEPTHETRRKYQRLVGRIGILLSKVQDAVFLGGPPRLASRRGRTVGQAGEKMPIKSLSRTDADRCERIGKDKISELDNALLCKTYYRTEKALAPILTRQAFRQSINRIRVRFGLPSSQEIKKNG
jgi:hypothetical protein